MSNGYELLEDPWFYVGSVAAILVAFVAIGPWISREGNPGMSAHVKDGKIRFRRTGRRRAWPPDGISD